MGRNRFVEPESVRIDIGDGDWIEVKKHLTIGESRRQHAAVIKDVRADGSMSPDIEMLGKAEVLAYLVDWSFCDASGKRVSIDKDAAKVAAVDSLTLEDFKIINDAISAHADQMAAQRAAEKNVRDGVNASSTTSPSAA